MKPCTYQVLDYDIALQFSSFLYPKTRLYWLELGCFSVRFQDAIEAKGFWGHFDGSKPRPEPLPAPAPTATAEGARPAPGCNTIRR